MTTVEDIKAMFPEIDLEAIRAKYAFERDRRERGDAGKLYRRATGELAKYGVDPHTPVAAREAVNDHVEVLVIGGGIAGLSVAARLRESGIESLRIVEEGGDFGGTWYWNRYPGLRVDIESHVYIPRLEEIGGFPTERYSRGYEIREFLHKLARHFDLYRDALMHTRATGIEWQDGRWVVRTDRGDAFTATYVIAASGGLATPKLPNIPGIEDFQGALFHSSRWDYSVTGGGEREPLTGLEGKRVGVIGTGATGVQIVPEVAKYAERVTVFQRTPSTVSFRGNQATDETWIGPGEPGWQRRRMDNFLAMVSGANPEEDLVKDGWTENWRLLRRHNTGTYVSELEGELRELYEEYLDARVMNAVRARVDEIVEDPKTAELLKPWYRFACKRPTFTDLYLPAFNQPNVELVDTADFGGPSQVTEKSVIVGDQEYPIDVLVVATGFEAGMTAVLSGTLPVIGRKGRSIREVWSKGLRTLHGYMTHEFPNFFQMGPVQSPNAVNFSHILQLHGEHVTAMIAAARQAGAAYIEPTREMEDAWSAELLEVTAPEADVIVAFKAACTPGFYNGEGKYRATPSEYRPGPVVFQAMLADWRANRFSEVLHSAEDLLDDATPVEV
ncbi:NAD(P)/FAD-dependent oxidoreductase [Actinospica sp. MGRD01-02]|uniref:NAD(P)/FAD-dependent oxidoreductase n=1 Tax=Actinospica acidithermotolerans TaxID=2828514 RepID=A0A941E8V9_9ACTN|nr:NAD(P)/FAD-dependent oxidoreductase [Actinospica acidithermotolerans]MBR7825670.1 NAD(P)/FAD-dependent oxidoreductase [Actinospica acidithermotolerans]